MKTLGHDPLQSKNQTLYSFMFWCYSFMFWYSALYAEGICNTAALPATKGCGEWAGEGHQHEGSDTNSFHL